MKAILFVLLMVMCVGLNALSVQILAHGEMNYDVNIKTVMIGIQNAANSAINDVEIEWYNPVINENIVTFRTIITGTPKQNNIENIKSSIDGYFNSIFMSGRVDYKFEDYTILGE